MEKLSLYRAEEPFLLKIFHLLRVAEVIQQGCEEEIFKTQSPLECAEFLLSAIQFLTDIGIYPWSEKVLNRRIQAFPGLVEQFLQAPSGSFQFLVE